MSSPNSPQGCTSYNRAAAPKIVPPTVRGVTHSLRSSYLPIAMPEERVLANTYEHHCTESYGLAVFSH